MKGLTLLCSEDNTRLMASVQAHMLYTDVTIENITLLGGEYDEQNSADEVPPFSFFSLLPDRINQLNNIIAQAQSNNKTEVIEHIIGELKQPTIEVSIADDAMSASIKITKNSTARLPNITELIAVVKQNNVIRGYSRKRLTTLLETANAASIGDLSFTVIAKGLPPRDGKCSHIKPLVSNAFERILRPQKNGIDSKVDMRNLGEILIVQKDTPVAKRIAPSKGRAGFDVRGGIIAAQAGLWEDIKLGHHTAFSPQNENIIVADVAGLPKFNNGIMSVDDTYVADSGVNVGTGSINYDGAVIVNGDVTENMEIIAKGDITINGFVESALIRAGGDIIITQGSTGKVQNEDCQLLAGGSIFIEHAQGLDIQAGKNLNIAKQLAHCRVQANGNVTVGAPDNPMGTLFACTIKCGKIVEAGSIGAMSGSALNIDFSEGYKRVYSINESLSGLFKQLSSSNSSHEIRMSYTKNKSIPDNLKEKMSLLNNQLDSQRALLDWLRVSLQKAQANKQDYEANARVIANKELFPGVTVTLNDKSWKGAKELQRSHLLLEDGSWQCFPLLT